MLSNCLFAVPDKLTLQWIEWPTDGKIHLVMSLQAKSLGDIHTCGLDAEYKGGIGGFISG